MSNSTLEKLLDILRSKMIGTTDQETGDAVGTKVKRLRNASTSSSEQDLDEEEEEDEGRQRDDEEDDGNVDDDDGKGTPYREKVADRMPVIENGIKLSGPVTDL